VRTIFFLKHLGEGIVPHYKEDLSVQETFTIYLSLKAQLGFKPASMIYLFIIKELVTINFKQLEK